ncbi:helix-turn-helix transcriptional regulator [Rhizobium sp. CFBP 8762]|nr:helix-turn-helix transcriptional regulator [Rhizobium sp. CFBP 8762]
MKSASLPSLAATNGLIKLGEDISAARRRRKITQKRLADGAGVSLPTIRRLENGDPGVSLATLAMVLVVLGEGQRLSNLLDVRADDVGLMLAAQQLPQRIRSPRKKASVHQSEQATGTVAGLPQTNEEFGEGF